MSALLANVSECLKRLTDDGNAPRGWEAALAAYVEEALCSHTGDLRELAQCLVESTQARLRSSSDAVRAVINHENSAPEHVRQALRLGQLGFAQLLISDAAERRAGSEFVAQLTLPKFRKYVQALARSEMTNSELAETVGETQESASRKLQQLRLHGLTDYRRESKNAINFLTPAARQALTVATDQAPPIAEEARSSVNEAVEAPRSKIEHLGIEQTYEFDLWERDGDQEAGHPFPAAVMQKAQHDVYIVGHLREQMRMKLPAHMRRAPTFALAL